MKEIAQAVGAAVAGFVILAFVVALCAGAAAVLFVLWLLGVWP